MQYIIFERIESRNDVPDYVLPDLCVPALITTGWMTSVNSHERDTVVCMAERHTKEVLEADLHSNPDVAKQQGRHLPCLNFNFLKCKKNMSIMHNFHGYYNI